MIGEIWINYFTKIRMRRDLIEILLKVTGIFNYGRYFSNISLWTGNLFSRQISETESANQPDFFANVNIFGKKI